VDQTTQTEVTPEQLYEAMLADYPDHADGTRPVHAVGIGATGYFEPSTVAARYSVAEHFASGRVPVTIRFSNGTGSPQVRDGAQDVRGLAAKFHLPSGAEADLIMITLPLFFAATPAGFLGFAVAGIPAARRPESLAAGVRDAVGLRVPLPPADPEHPDGLAGVLEYADRDRTARPGTIAALTLVTPTSYARVTYHALHAFKMTDPEGVVRYGRFTWEPVAGVRPHPDLQPPDDYLRPELAERLHRAPARFVLRMTVAEQGDPLDDPTKWWDTTRLRVVMGELVVTDIAEDQNAGCEKLSFNPTRVVPGFECSDDPILAARGRTYELSCRERGGTGCPIGGALL
jgi:catalase